MTGSKVIARIHVLCDYNFTYHTKHILNLELNFFMNKIAQPPFFIKYSQ